MSIRRPLSSIISSAPQQKKAPTFGEYRAERMSQRLEKAVTERKTLARAQAATVDPLSTHIENKGNLVANKIGRLQQEIATQQEIESQKNDE